MLGKYLPVLSLSALIDAGAKNSFSMMPMVRIFDSNTWSGARFNGEIEAIATIHLIVKIRLVIKFK